ncbi:MAG: hypothetical protein JKY22_12345 [Flavobacteriaceae bacterium]|nr:hypothetical protein [Flavobacteriaceae bacterium]
MKGKFTDKEKAIFDALESKKAPIQIELDKLNKEIQKASLVVSKIRAKVSQLKPRLVPIAELQAGLASPISRDKYFSHLSKDDFIKYAEKESVKT